MTKKSRFSTYNDGMLYVCKNDAGKSDFGAVKNAKCVYDLDSCLKLAFCEMSKRDEDMDFAESQGRKLSLKIKTRLFQKVNKLNQIIICNVLYSIIKIDYDKSNGEMFIYLEEERRLT